MNDRIGVLVIHGMGSQGPGFSNLMVSELKDRLKTEADVFDFEEVHWADALEDRERSLLTWMNSAREPSGTQIDLDWMKARRFVVHNFGDALAYQRACGEGGSAYNLIHDIVSDRVQALRGRLPSASTPIVVIAHSLGAQIMSDYIWDQQKTTATRTTMDGLVGLVTFGNNIPLFSLAYDLARPIRLPGKAIRKASLKSAARWLNFVDADDVLGWPLKPLYKMNISKLRPWQKTTVKKIEDYEINVGGFITKWNPAAHAKYWTDNDLTVPAAKFLQKLARAL